MKLEQLPNGRWPSARMTARFRRRGRLSGVLGSILSAAAKRQLRLRRLHYPERLFRDGA